MVATMPGTPYKRTTMTIEAGASRYFQGDIRYLVILDATDATSVEVSFNGSSYTYLPKGWQLSNFQVDGIWIRNTSGAPNDVTFTYGSADVRNSNVVIDSSSTLPMALADGADVTLGAKADAAAASDNGAASVVALLKRMLLRKMPDAAKSVYTLDSAATVNAQSVKAASGRLYSILAFNPSGAAKYLRVYDLAAAPTVGTDIATRVIAIPAGGHVAIDFAGGDNFANGIAIAITGAAAYNDATAVAAHDVQLTINYL